MDNPTGSVNGNVGARAEVRGRAADLPKGFRNQVVLGMALIAALAGAAWLFLAGPSDREVIDDRLAEFGIPATYVGEATGDGYLYTINRACGDQITVTIDVGEAPLDGPRQVTIDEDGSRAVRLNDSTMPGFVNF